MRRYAYLKEPILYDGLDSIYKVMICESDGGFYLFEYCKLDALNCSNDRFYETIDEIYEEWNDLIDDRGWIEIDDPLPGCQHDAFEPIRVKGRDVGKPEWGKYEILKDGEWISYEPEIQK